jgi:hypothetical protein
MRPGLFFSVPPRRVLLFLGATILLIVCFSVAGQYSTHVLGHGRLLGFVHGFNVDEERNVPAHFSALMLLSVSILAGLIASRVRRTEGPFYGHWVGLALVFVVLAADELNSFHERLISPLRTLLDADGILYFTWVVPGMAVVALFGLAYARFLWHLPVRWALLFVGSGITFVAGAVGVELIGGWYMSQYAPFTGTVALTYDLITTLEETLEMAGVAVFIYALLDYLRAHVGTIRIALDAEPREPPAAPARSPVRRTPVETAA